MKKLERSFMKNLKGGFDDEGLGCTSGTCSVYVPDNGNTYQGHCGIYDVGGGYLICECVTPYGPYTPQGGTSHCYN